MPVELGLSPLERCITGRAQSFFAEDMTGSLGPLSDRIENSRILMIGAAGSIGAETLKTILHFNPRTLHVVDHNENGLAELVRSLRSKSDALSVEEFLTMPFDYGSAPFRLWLESHAADYDYVLNFAALKHVRSEKDPFSILAMLDTNVLKLEGLAKLLSRRQGVKRLFCVSTDKAANPSSMMGATKRLMEHALFSSTLAWPAETRVTSARFANVAFSNGSLLQSWQFRLASRQAMACPENCRRFFVGLTESGHLCTLAGLLGEDRNVYVPALEPARHLTLLQDVAVQFLESHGLAPWFTTDAAAARHRVEELAAKKMWPVLLTPLDTAGEKPFEEFVGDGEQALPAGFQSLLRVPYLQPADPGAFAHLLAELRAIMRAPAHAEPLTVERIRGLISKVEVGFAQNHVNSTKSLDQRM